MSAQTFTPVRSFAIARASLSIAIGTLATGASIALVETLLISKVAAGLIAIGFFYLGARYGPLLVERIRRNPARVEPENQVRTAIETALEGGDATEIRYEREAENLTTSLKRMKVRLADRGIRYSPPAALFERPAPDSRDRSEALKMCHNAKKLLDFAISMGDSEETIKALTAEMDHWLHILNHPAGSLQGQV
jgi:hypothetical protein